MTIENRIKIIVENNIPLDPKCQVKRKEQMLQRVQLRLQIERLFRELSSLQNYEPRTQLK